MTPVGSMQANSTARLSKFSTGIIQVSHENRVSHCSLFNALANAPQVFGIIDDIDHTGAEFYGIVMPLMSCSLRDVLDTRYRPSVPQVLSWLISAATTLADVFEKAGAVHGDIKVGGPETSDAASPPFAPLVSIHGTPGR